MKYSIVQKALFPSFLLMLFGSLPVLAADPTDGRGPITKGQRIYYTGHSFLMFIPPFIDEFALAQGITGQINKGSSNIGGSAVMRHWEVGSKGKVPLEELNHIYGKEITESMVSGEQNLVKKTLGAGQVDVLTTAPLYTADEGIEKFAALALQHNPNIRVTVEQIWLRRGDATEPVPKDYPHLYKSVEDYNTATIAELRERSAPMFKNIDDYVVGLNRKLGKPVAFVVPAGQAVIALRERVVAGKAGQLKTQAQLFRDLTGHGTLPMQVMVAYCHFAVIYRRSPVGLPMPSILANDKRFQWNAETVRVLQEVAWEAVTNHPLSGVQPLASAM